MSQARLTKDIGTRANFTFKELGQLLPADTNAASLYSPPSTVLFTEITRLVICNVTGNARAYRIFCDTNGSTYSTATALYYDVALAANTTQLIDIDIHMNNSSGNIAVRSDAASEICFTAYGVEVIK